jgi:hypothetical protein
MTPARNRVSPRGDIIAVAGRGAWLGNRGRLHEGRGARDIVRNSRGKAWITCVLEFRGRHSEQWAPNHYTQLFFLDEAVAFAAGHRPCADAAAAITTRTGGYGMKPVAAQCLTPRTWTTCCTANEPHRIGCRGLPCLMGYSSTQTTDRPWSSADISRSSTKMPIRIDD